MIVLKQLALLARNMPRVAMAALFSPPTLPDAIRDAALDMGPVYVKLLQVMSTRADVLPENFRSVFATLCDRAPVVSDDVMRPLIERAFYPRKLDDVFSEFPQAPIAAGAIAQVYKAKLSDGSLVAVKILRPHVRLAIEGNFKVLRAAASALAFCSKSFHHANIVGIVHELQELLLAQTNLEQEAANLEEFHRLFAGSSQVIAPRTYPEHSTQDALVMEFIEGTHPKDFRQLAVSPLVLAGRVDFLVDIMIFFKGFCHADLHPGNFFWNESGQLVLIDFGLVYRVDEMDRNHLMAFYSSIVEGYYDWAARYFIRYFLHKATPLSQAEEESIFHEMRAAIIDLFVEASGKPQFSLVFGNLLKIIIKHKLQLSPVLSRLALTLTSAEGYILQLDPSFNMMENARRKKLEMTEYASVSPEAERLVLGEFGTYSMPMFRKGLSPAQAWALRDEFVFEQLALRPGEFVIDVGCGRGRHLELARSKGARALGLTISRTEQELCASRQLDCLLTSWEDFEHNAKDAYPIADAMLAIEMFPHLASLHENREGLLDYRLRRFFEWARKRLDAGGRLFIQSLDISEAFLHDPAHEAQFLAVSRALPWIGFSTREQIKGLCAPHFHVTQHWDGTSDLRPTFQLWSQNMELHTATLERILKPSVLSHLGKELAIMMELVASGHLTLSRWLLTASTAH